MSKTDKLSQNDLNQFANLLDNQFDKRFKPFVEEQLETKLSDLKLELKTYIHEGVETIMDGMDNLATELTKNQKSRNF